MLFKVFLLLSLLALSCQKNDNSQPLVYYKAEVVSTDDINCHRPRIQIDGSDVAAVSLVTGLATDMYIANQLPASLNTTGQKISITIARFEEGEDFTCGTIGVSYAHLKVLTAISRE